MSARLRLEIDVHGSPSGNMSELCLAEVRHHVPRGDVDEREDLSTGPGERPDGDIEVDDPPAEGGLHARVLEVQLGRVHRRLRSGHPGVHAPPLSPATFRSPPPPPGPLNTRLAV